MNKKDLIEFIESYVTGMELAGNGTYLYVNEAVKTTLFIIENEDIEMEIIYHNELSTREGMIYVMKLNFDLNNLDRAFRIKEWLELFSDEYTLKEKMDKYFVSFSADSIKKFIDFFKRCILKQEEIS